MPTLYATGAKSQGGGKKLWEVAKERGGVSVKAWGQNKSRNGAKRNDGYLAGTPVSVITRCFIPAIVFVTKTVPPSTTGKSA